MFARGVRHPGALICARLPAISTTSVTGAALVLAVAEPTPSGLHDLERVAELTRDFGIPTLGCVNKWDLNLDVCEWTEAGRGKRASDWQAGFATTAASQKRRFARVVVEYGQDGCVTDLRAVWTIVTAHLNGRTNSG